jgi:hypothetical protein
MRREVMQAFVDEDGCMSRGQDLGCCWSAVASHSHAGPGRSRSSSRSHRSRSRSPHSRRSSSRSIQPPADGTAETHHFVLQNTFITCETNKHEIHCHTRDGLIAHIQIRVLYNLNKSASRTCFMNTRNDRERGENSLPLTNSRKSILRSATK